MAKKRNSGRAARASRRPLAIENRQRAVKLEIAPLETFFRKACREIGLKYPPAAVCFITDREMRRLNPAYGKKRKRTDVLSFPWEERRKPKSLKDAAASLRGGFLGGIAILPTVGRRKAKQFGRTM